MGAIYKLFQDAWEKYQTVWLFSDPHFDDEELAQAYPERPSAQEMVDIINGCAGKRDLLILLGDISDLGYLRRIKADKWLVLGNHDQGVSNYLRTQRTYTFNKEYYPTKESIKEMIWEWLPDQKIISIDDEGWFWTATVDNRLCDQVFEGPLQVGEKLILSHEPIPLLTWARNVHGHDHSDGLFKDKYHYNICCDAFGYKPFNLTRALKTGFLSDIESLHKVERSKS